MRQRSFTSVWAGALFFVGGLVLTGGGPIWCAAAQVVPETVTWTWMKGASTSNPSGIYGTRTVPGTNNTPGGRSGGCTWTDNSGALWLFGGQNSNNQRFNDLWKYDRVSGRWTWMKGASTSNQKGTYGTLGTPGTANTPGARTLAAAWTDTFGNLWLFGGTAYDLNGNSGPINDLWKYDTTSGNWTWMKGASTIHQRGNYGTLGSPAEYNTPGARDGSVSWTDPWGAQWLFGGYGFDASGTVGYLSDLWKYDPGTGNWTWMKGPLTPGQAAVYGTLGTPAGANTPGARKLATSWTGLSGELWLFGGFAYNSVGGGGIVNDLWKFEPATGNWTWMKGNSTINQLGVYGTLGTQAAANTPGARDQAVSWTAPSGALWLFGGVGYPGSGDSGFLSDLWKYDPITGNWAWIKGPSTYNESGTYGTLGTPATANTPGARLNPVSWADASGALWLLGGVGIDGAASSGSLNDLWRAAGPTDTASPVITRLGANPVTMMEVCQTSYTDAGATAVDAYGIDLTASLVTANPVNVAVHGSYTVRYNVVDGRGNRSREVTRTVKVLKMPPPVITRLGQDTITLECPASYSDAGATAVDACGRDLTGGIAVTNPVNGNTPGSYTVRYNVADGEGHNAVEATRTVNIVDTGKPVLTRRGNAAITVECGETYIDAGVTGTDACAGDIAGRIGVTNPVSVNTPGTYTVRYNANDGSGNLAAEVMRTVTVADTTPPVLTLSGKATVTTECHTAYTDAGATATDACAGNVTGRIGVSNPVDVNSPGTYTVRYNVNDGNGNTAAEVTRTVNVVDTTPPVIARLGAASVTVECSTEGYTDAGATASDNCRGDLTANISTLNPVNAAVVGTYTVTYNVSDAAGNSAAEVARIVTVVSATYHVDAKNSAGPWDGKTWATAFRDIQSAEDKAKDTGGEVWVAAGTYTGAADPVVTMRPGVSLYGGFAGTETSSAHRNWSSNVTIIDGENARRCVSGADNSTLDGFTVTRGQSVNGGGMHNNAAAFLAVANCTFTGNTATYDSGEYGGGGAMCNDASSPTLTNCVFTHNSAVQCGGALYNASLASPTLMNCTFTQNTAASGGGVFNYSDAAPALTNCILWGDTAATGQEIQDYSGAAPVVTHSCVQGGYAGTGNLSNDPLFVDAGAGDLQLQACISPCVDKGTAAGAPGSDIRGMARPQGGGVDMGAYETADDIVPPVIALAGPSTASAECGVTYTDSGATVTDNCATGLAVTVGGDTVSTAFLGAVYTLTYNAHDGTGNSAVEVKRTVTVVDAAPPVITRLGGAAVAVECHGSYTDEGATADDACAGDRTGSIVVTNPVDVNTPAIYTVRYNVNDGNGNDAVEVTRTVEVVDTTKPAMTLLGDATVSLEWGAAYTDAGATASDVCAGDLTVSVGGAVVNTSIPGVYTVTYNANDGNGNDAVEVTRTVSVVDTAKPVIMLLGEAEVTLDCGQEYTDAGATASDVAWGNLTGDLVASGLPPAEPLPPGTWNVAYDVRDGSGNAADTVWRTVTVRANCTLAVTAEGNTLVHSVLGEQVQISVVVKNAVGPVSFLWRKESPSQGGKNLAPLPGATENPLVIKPVTAESEGLYVCAVSDAVTTVDGPVFTLAPPAKAVPAAGLFGLVTAAAALSLGGLSTLRRRRR